MRAGQPKLLVLAAALLLVAAAVPAQAGVITQVGSGFSIPDATPAGASSNIMISDVYSLTNVRVTLTTLTHTWLSDLIATITHVETGTTVSLFNRVGGPGEASDFNGNYAFDDSFTSNLWTVAAGLGSNDAVPTGNYYATGAGSSTQVFLSGFNGQSTAGTWRLNISDNSSGDTGALGSWSLALTYADPVVAAVPEPSTLVSGSLAGLIGLGVMLRRRVGRKAGLSR
jgi:subtilisin-like proprotein convertase family protein